MIKPITISETCLNRNIIGLVYNMHIDHNCAETALVSMPIDIKVLITKILEYFNMCKIHIEHLKDLWDFAWERYEEIRR
jgi:hypothetical protein